jgi:hypothetical protein
MKVKNRVMQSAPDYENQWLVNGASKTQALPECGLIAVRDDNGQVLFYDDEFSTSAFTSENINEKFRIK